MRSMLRKCILLARARLRIDFNWVRLAESGVKNDALFWSIELHPYHPEKPATARDNRSDRRPGIVSENTSASAL